MSWFTSVKAWEASICSVSVQLLWLSCLYALRFDLFW
jgi:hypothetical protein